MFNPEQLAQLEQLAHRLDPAQGESYDDILRRREAVEAARYEAILYRIAWLDEEIRIAWEAVQRVDSRHRELLRKDREAFFERRAAQILKEEEAGNPYAEEEFALEGGYHEHQKNLLTVEEAVHQSHERTHYVQLYNERYQLRKQLNES